jgi:hypothetical protein
MVIFALTGIQIAFTERSHADVCDTGTDAPSRAKPGFDIYFKQSSPVIHGTCCVRTCDTRPHSLLSLIQL